MDRQHRLRSSREWRRVRRQGRCAGGQYCVICVLMDGTGERFGFTTAKGFRTAVRRNRARRRLREAFRQVYVADEQPRAVTVTAKLALLDADFEELKRSIALQARSLGLPVREV